MYDNINLTPEMQKAVDIISNSNDNIFITGKAGSGKTTLLRYITHNVSKRFIVCAPTGVAAVNCHGVTLHHQFHIPFGFVSMDIDPAAKFNTNTESVLKEIDAIVVDEASLVRADVLDYVDRSLRMYRRKDIAFGGVQMIFIGDMKQLPPVVKKEEQELMDIYYEGAYFFFASVFAEKGFHVVELNTVFRQKDDRFVTTLNHIRDYVFTEQDRELLKTTYNKNVVESIDVSYVHLCTHKKMASEINQAMLGEYTHSYNASISKDFNIGSCTCDNVLNLRIGARVMALVNDKDMKYHNGSCGQVTKLSDDSVDVLFDNGIKVTFQRYTWSEYYYKNENGIVQQYEKGTCTQFPLTLAWACSIHKSQGMQWDKVAIHIGNVFAPGMIYVALSRCTSIEGLATSQYITKRHIVTDHILKKFQEAIQKTNFYFDKNTIKCLFN